jgi:signal transduction histidine kinase
MPSWFGWPTPSSQTAGNLADSTTQGGLGVELSSRFGADGIYGLKILSEDSGLVFGRGWREGAGGERVQLQQVILNLIMNASEAVSEVEERPPELSISTGKAESNGVLVTVSDTGPGLPPETLARIFEPFYTTKANGLGMGLSICRSIVEAHGGQLWATPNEPHGAVFCMMLPIGGKSLLESSET